MASAQIEQKVFDHFLAITPTLAGRPLTCTLGANPPDILCTDNDHRIGIEMSEWLDEAQIANEKPQYQREEEFLNVINSKTVPPPTNIGRIMFFEHEGIRLATTDAQAFRKELYACINDLDARWHTFDGHDEPPGVDIHTTDLAAYPTLATYTHSLGCTAQQYDSSTLGDEWIAFMSHGGAYAPDTALDAAITTLQKKTSMYATLKADEHLAELYLLLYYDQGWAYNTPFTTPTFGFDDVASALRTIAANDHGQFDRIFLFIPATDAVAEIYP